MTSPFRKLGVLYVAATPALAGISMFEFRIGGLNYTGFVWVAQLLAGLYLLSMILLTGRRQLDLTPWYPWFAWLGYLWLSLVWTKEMDGKNVQDALQYTMPIAVGIIAATSIRTAGELKLVFASFVFALVGVSCYTFLFVKEIFDYTWLETHVRSAALTTTVMGCVFLAAFPGRWVLPLAGWGACIAITTLTSSRMATLALLAAFVLHPLVRSLRWKVAAVATCVLIGLGLFYTPTFQKHFFAGGSGDIGDLASGKVDDLGRLEAWTQAWDRAVETPLLGKGVGSIHDFVDTIWEDTNQIHNDYLRLFYEVGLAGLAVYLSVAAWQLLALRNRIAESTGIARTALAGSYLGLCALLITCLTDNTITYNLFYTDPLFAMLGAAYGVLAGERLRDEALAGAESLAARQWKLEAARSHPRYHGAVAPNYFPVHRGIRFDNQ
jgi:hypothetical protein